MLDDVCLKFINLHTFLYFGLDMQNFENLRTWRILHGIFGEQVFLFRFLSYIKYYDGDTQSCALTIGEMFIEAALQQLPPSNKIRHFGESLPKRLILWDRGSSLLSFYEPLV
jgi:hypothetical protein